MKVALISAIVGVVVIVFALLIGGLYWYQTNNPVYAATVTQTDKMFSFQTNQAGWYDTGKFIGARYTVVAVGSQGNFTLQISGVDVNSYYHDNSFQAHAQTWPIELRDDTYGSITIPVESSKIYFYSAAPQTITFSVTPMDATEIASLVAAQNAQVQVTKRREIIAAVFIVLIVVFFGWWFLYTLFHPPKSAKASIREVFGPMETKE